MRTARATQKQANMALEVGKSALLGVIISFVLVVLYAVALKEELLQVSTMGLFTTVIKVICAAAAGLIAVRRCKKRLWLYGALAGLYAILAFIVFSAVAGTLYVSIALLSDIAIGAVSGLISVMVLQMLK
jgi:putative membrane protein (TIGR04086 family)